MNLASSWTDYHADHDCWLPLNLKSLDVINLLDTSTALCVQNLKDNNDLVALTLDPISKEVLLVHRITQIGGTLFLPETRMVALNGFGSQASVVRLPTASKLFDCVADIEAPAPTSILKATTTAAFESLNPDLNEVERFRNFVLLPPCIASVIISSPSRRPQDLAGVVLASSANAKTQLKGTPDFDASQHDDAAARMLSFLWCCLHDHLDPPCVGFSPSSEATTWCARIHSEAILPAAPSAPSLSSATSPTNAVLTSLSQNMHQMTLNLERQ